MQAQYTIGQSEVQLSALRPVRLQDLNVPYAVPAHDHNFYEICLLETGSVVHQMSEGDPMLRENSVIVVPPGTVHAFADPRNLRVCNVYYLSEWFLWDLATLHTEGLVPLFFAASLFARPQDANITVFTLSEAEKAAVWSELCDIGVESAHPIPSQLWWRGAFSKLLVILSRAWRQDQPHLNDFDFSREVWLGLEAMEHAIKSGEPFRVDAFARQMGLSGDAFARLFRAATGLSPSDYFQKRRVAHASYLLLQTRESATQIAARLGYADSAHLTRLFTRVHGIGPRKFRRTFLENGPV